jgi:hypothetical protein
MTGISCFPQPFQKNVRILLSTYQESIPTGIAIYEHAQEFMAIDELLLPILIAFAQCTFSLHATRNAWYFQFLSTCKKICRSYQHKSGSLSVAKRPPHRARDAYHTAGLSHDLWSAHWPGHDRFVLNLFQFMLYHFTIRMDYLHGQRSLKVLYLCSS